MNDKILLENMMFYGYHGVYEYEREQGQRFYVDVELHLDFSAAAGYPGRRGGLCTDLQSNQSNLRNQTV